MYSVGTDDVDDGLMGQDGRASPDWSVVERRPRPISTGSSDEGSEATVGPRGDTRSSWCSESSCGRVGFFSGTGPVWGSGDAGFYGALSLIIYTTGSVFFFIAWSSAYFSTRRCVAH